MSIVIADYEAPRRAIEALSRRDCNYRILLIRGPSGGTGKTTLLRYCCEQMATSALHVPIELRDSLVNVAEIFSRIGQVIGWDHLPAFTKRLTASRGEPDVTIEHNRQTGFNNTINMLLRADNKLDREERRTDLTNVWFNDMAALPAPIVMLFDTYEDAPSEVRDWISGSFLARAAAIGAIRVVVAGRNIPERNNIAWGHCCQVYDLFGVAEASHWMPVVREMHRRIDVPDPDSWLAGVCHALGGIRSRSCR